MEPPRPANARPTDDRTTGSAAKTMAAFINIAARQAKASARTSGMEGFQSKANIVTTTKTAGSRAADRLSNCAAKWSQACGRCKPEGNKARRGLTQAALTAGIEAQATKIRTGAMPFHRKAVQKVFDRTTQTNRLKALPNHMPRVCGGSVSHRLCHAAGWSCAGLSAARSAGIVRPKPGFKKSRPAPKTSLTYALRRLQTKSVQPTTATPTSAMGRASDDAAFEPSRAALKGPGQKATVRAR